MPGCPSLSGSNRVAFGVAPIPDTRIGEALVSSTTSVRNAPLVVTAMLALLGVLLLVIAIFYFTKTSNHLPSFFPGHDAKHTYHHTKHGIAALVVGALALIGAWVTAGRKKTA